MFGYAPSISENQVSSAPVHGGRFLITDNDGFLQECNGYQTPIGISEVLNIGCVASVGAFISYYQPSNSDNANPQLELAQSVNAGDYLTSNNIGQGVSSVVSRTGVQVQFTSDDTFSTNQTVNNGDVLYFDGIGSITVGDAGEHSATFIPTLSFTPDPSTFYYSSSPNKYAKAIQNGVVGDYIKVFFIW